MSISIVTFANLGTKTNLKTAAILPVISTLTKQGALKQIICQINTGFEFPNTDSATPIAIRYIFRLFERTFKVSFSRKTTTYLFDFFASRKMQRTDIWLFHPGGTFPRSLRRSRALGAVSVNISTSAHLKTNASLEEEEMAFLGFENHDGKYSHYFREFNHANTFDYTIALSDFVRDSYIKNGYPAERVFVANTDIDIKRFTPRDCSLETFSVVYMAYTTPLKGLHYLLDAWQSLDLNRAQLIIVGGFGALPDSLRRRYETAITSDPSIRHVDGTQKPEDYYRNADVLAFPSLTEGFGRVTLEAMSCGVPVITTENAQGIVEDGKTGFVVPIRDSKALAEKIKYLYDHRDIAEQMGIEARKAVEAKKPFGEAVYEIYEEILRREGKRV